MSIIKTISGNKEYSKDIAGKIIKLAWPTMLEEIMQTAVQYIDTAMVGTLGTIATAAVGSTTTIGWMVFSTVYAFGVGFLALISKSCGEKNLNKAKDIAAQAVFAVLVLGALFTAVTLSLAKFVPALMQVDSSAAELAGKYFFIIYVPMIFRVAETIFGTVLRAAGDTKSPMKISLIMNIINVVLNFFLIFETRNIRIFTFDIMIPGAGMGVIGAAIASAVSFIWGGIHITIVLFKHPVISPFGHKIKPDAGILKPCFKISLPNMFQRFGTSLGYVVFASIINSIGDVATAAHTIANTVESAFYIPGYGMQTAAATLMGNAYGEKDKNKSEYLSSVFIPIEISLMIISGGFLFIFAPVLVNIFTFEPSVSALSVTVLRMVAVSEPFYGFSIIVEGMMMGVGKTTRPFIYNITGMWLIRILGSAVCIYAFHLGLISAWACMITHNLILFGLYLITYLRKAHNPLLRGGI